MGVPEHTPVRASAGRKRATIRAEQGTIDDATETNEAKDHPRAALGRRPRRGAAVGSRMVALVRDRLGRAAGDRAPNAAHAAKRAVSGRRRSRRVPSHGRREGRGVARVDAADVGRALEGLVRDRRGLDAPVVARIHVAAACGRLAFAAYGSCAPVGEVGSAHRIRRTRPGASPGHCQRASTRTPDVKGKPAVPRVP